MRRTQPTLDSDIASVFHTTYTTGGSALDYAGNPAELSAVCYDLGYRPSDILQTNCVIWVEGPSDRIYLAHWIRIVNPALRENIDFAIMFYGGRLLNHLSPDDPEVGQFISLRRLNRHLAVVMDSDRETGDGGIGEAKRRVRDEMAAPGGCVDHSLQVHRKLCTTRTIDDRSERTSSKHRF